MKNGRVRQDDLVEEDMHAARISRTKGVSVISQRTIIIYNIIHQESRKNSFFSGPATKA